MEISSSPGFSSTLWRGGDGKVEFGSASASPCDAMAGDTECSSSAGFLGQHYEIKPEPILGLREDRGASGVVVLKLSDFGLAKLGT